jgi:hypothetical protein
MSEKSTCLDTLDDTGSDVTQEACTSIFYQKETVCVPVHVKPYATPGSAKVICCSTPSVSTTRESICTGNQTACSFTVTQDLCIEIPIAFGAEIETGSALVECGGVSETGCDCIADDGTVEQD